MTTTSLYLNKNKFHFELVTLGNAQWFEIKIGDENEIVFFFQDENQKQAFVRQLINELQSQNEIAA